uniref:Major royal jelly protein n=2 Tax=Lutzomyia longipalpis TaxID=7200 RepID=A0A1B0CBH4_LUTLO
MNGSLVAFLLATIACIPIATSVPASSKVQVQYSWKTFIFEDLPHSPYAKVDGYDYYISKNILPTGISYHDTTNCFFFPILRWHRGIPATITYINPALYKDGSSPPLRAFPTYVDNYLPGWFGVNDLGAYDYNIYATDVNTKRNAKSVEKIEEEVPSETNIQEEIPSAAEDKKKHNEEEDDDEVRKKHSSHHKPIHSHHGGQYVVQVPVPVPAPPPKITTTTTTAPAPTYKPSYKPSYKPPYKPPPPKNPTRDVYHFISVYFTSANEKCSRLFFLDHGTVVYDNVEIFIRRPLIWAFDIYECSDEGFGYPPALRVSIPDSVVERPAGISYFGIDMYGNCAEFYVYITNCFDNRIIVYDNAKRSFWYFEHDTFKPGAERSLYPGPLPPEDSYDFGVLGLIIAGENSNSYRDVFYSPGSSYGLFKTSTQVLRNKALAPGSPTSPDFSFVGYGGQDGEAITNYDSESQVLFFVHLVTATLQCWNTNLPLVKGNVATLFSDLEFGTDISIDNQRNLRFINYFGHGVPYWEADIPSNAYYRFYKAPIDDLIKGTVCDPRNV